MTEERDGFEIVRMNGEVVRFIPCTKNESMRDKVLMGLLRNMNTDAYFVRDTRDEE